MNNTQAAYTFTAFGYSDWNNFVNMLISAGRVSANSGQFWIKW